MLNVTLPPVHPWSARALAPVLDTPPAASAPTPDPMQPVRVTSKWVKPDKAARNAKRHPAPMPPEPYAEDDTAHWFQEERWIEQPFVEPPMLISDTTDWCAWSPCWSPVPSGVAARDSFSAGYVYGIMAEHGMVKDGRSMYTAEPPAAAPAFDTAPLVAARERKEQMLVKIPKSADCPEAHGRAPLAYVKDPAEHALVMDAYQARIRGDAGAQERWNAISAGKTQGLTVAESLARFGRAVVLS